MKKLISVVLSLMLIFALAVPSFAYDMGQVEEYATVISTGAFHSAAVDKDGVLWMWGFNPHGECTNNCSYGTNYIPVQIMEDVVSVSCGSYHTAVIKADNSLWMWGLNDEGQLGNGGAGNAILADNATCQTEPVKVLDDVASVCCGGGHTAAIKSDGTLWMWGSNLFGELGNGGIGNDTYARGIIQTVPVKVMENVVAVSCGFYTTAVIKTDGTLWMWGYNNSGELGNGGVGNADYQGMTIQTLPIKIMDNVVAVSCAADHAAAIQTDGSLWIWGVNYSGQLGNGDSGENTGSSVPVKIMDNVVAVSCNGSATAVIKTDNTLWMWGSNRYGELGIDGVENHDNLGSNTTAAVQTAPIKVMDRIATVSCGSVYTVATKTDSTLWAWGSNKYGQLGTGSGTFNNPTAVKNGITVANMNGSIHVDRPSTWAEVEVNAAILYGLVPENLQKNYQLPVSRGEVAQMFINLIEQSSGKPINEFMEEKGVEVNPSAFTDTSDKAVLAANALGIIQGVGNNKFDPDGTFTRAQIAAIINHIARVLGVDTDGYSHSFSDVVGHWVDSELGWPSSVGIINGVGNNEFDPDTDLTTEQAIAITYRALQVLKQ